MLWQRSQTFAADLILLIRDLPRDIAINETGRQLIRSATSIGANIAEGYGRYSPGAYRNHLSIARGSAFETEAWIDLLVRTGYIAPEIGEGLIARCTELQRLLSYRMKALEQSSSRMLKEEQVSYEAN